MRVKKPKGQWQKRKIIENLNFLCYIIDANIFFFFALLSLIIFCSLNSRIFNANGVLGWHNCEIRDLGHCGTRALSQFSTHVLSRCSGSNRRIWYNQSGDVCFYFFKYYLTIFKTTVFEKSCGLLNFIESYSCIEKILLLHSLLIIIFLFICNRTHLYARQRGWKSYSDKRARV